jgi:hypothetical protein
MRILPILALCLPLLTGGCFVGDGVAHVVKLASKSGNKSDDAGQTASSQPAPAYRAPAPASAAPIDRDPAPMPAAAASPAIQSEDLAPPR